MLFIGLICQKGVPQNTTPPSSNMLHFSTSIFQNFQPVLNTVNLSNGFSSISTPVLFIVRSLTPQPNHNSLFISLQVDHRRPLVTYFHQVHPYLSFYIFTKRFLQIISFVSFRHISARPSLIHHCFIFILS